MINFPFSQNNLHFYSFGYTNHERGLCSKIDLNNNLGFRQIMVQKARAFLVYSNRYTIHRLELPNNGPKNGRTLIISDLAFLCEK